NSEFTIRPMIPNDAGGLKEIIDISFSRFMRFFALHSIQEEQQVLVCDTQEAVTAGFVKLIDIQLVGGKFGCILWIAVHPQFRRRGIATALVNAGLGYLKDAGAKAVFASVQRRNNTALTVFTRQGFRKMGFLELWRLFGWRVFEFYSDIWLAPGEIVLMHD
ncbi:MAG TPA: GNAT family N-acetyltransferase, partial [archaeon]|nr:GNAT family N-acetyltransferase [archaeon]